MRSPCWTPASCRLALKADASPGRRDGLRLVFQVADLDAARAALLARGEAVSEPVENRAERYRAVKLTDPEGTPIRLFAWSLPESDSGSGGGIGPE